MNALDLLDELRRHGAHLAVEGADLVVRGTGRPLPQELCQELADRKPEILVALGAPLDEAVATVLDEIRPHLSPALRKLPDSKLLALVNWHLIAAWGKAVREFHR